MVRTNHHHAAAEKWLISGDSWIVQIDSTRLVARTKRLAPSARLSQRAGVRSGFKVVHSPEYIGRP